MGGKGLGLGFGFQDLSQVRISQLCFPQVLLGQTWDNFLWGSDCGNGTITLLLLSMGLSPILLARDSGQHISVAVFAAGSVDNITIIFLHTF